MTWYSLTSLPQKTAEKQNQQATLADQRRRLVTQHASRGFKRRQPIDGWRDARSSLSLSLSSRCALECAR